MHRDYKVVSVFAFDLAEEGSAMLSQLCCSLVALQRFRELIHEKLGVTRLLLCKILHVTLQEHQAAVPYVQLVPHVLENH